MEGEDEEEELEGLEVEEEEEEEEEEDVGEDGTEEEGEGEEDVLAVVLGTGLKKADIDFWGRGAGAGWKANLGVGKLQTIEKQQEKGGRTVRRTNRRTE
jgi:hypothetical protein